jgi:hypothetical protein
MKEFLREYWLWIVVPILAIGALAAYVVIDGSNDAPQGDNFEYDI